MAKMQCSARKAFSRGEYIVREGDTLADVLRVSGASVGELAAFNARCDLLRLRPGQRLRVPFAACPGRRTYRVRRGEDVYSLAHKFGSSVVSLLRVNSHLLPGEIRHGAQIALPEEPGDLSRAFESAREGRCARPAGCRQT